MTRCWFNETRIFASSATSSSKHLPESSSLVAATTLPASHAAPAGVPAVTKPFTAPKLVPHYVSNFVLMRTSMKRDFQFRRGASIPVWAALTATCLCGTSVLLAQEAKPGTENTPKEEGTKSEETPKLDETAKTEADYRNWFDVSVGGNVVKGNKAQFMERHQLPQGAYGGVSDFHYEQDVGKKGLFEIDGRGIFDNHDYSLRLNFQNPDYGYLRGGYREFRTWYNGTGGYLPVNDQMFHLDNEEFAIDRGDPATRWPHRSHALE